VLDLELDEIRAGTVLRDSTADVLELSRDGLGAGRDTSLEFLFLLCSIWSWTRYVLDLELDEIRAGTVLRDSTADVLELSRDGLGAGRDTCCWIPQQIHLLATATPSPPVPDLCPSEGCLRIRLLHILNNNGLPPRNWRMEL